jgi:hypothetical protein
LDIEVRRQPRPSLTGGAKLSTLLTSLDGESALDALEKDTALQPRNPTRLSRDPAQVLGGDSSQLASLVGKLHPKLADAILPGLSSFQIEQDKLEYYAVKEARLFGHSAVPQAVSEIRRPQTEPVPAVGENPPQEEVTIRYVEWTVADAHKDKSFVFLDKSYPQVEKGTPMVLRVGDREEAIWAAGVGSPVTVAEYGLSAESTRVDLPLLSDGTSIWISEDFSVIRRTSVYVATNLLDLADQPIDPVLRPVEGNRIELAGLFQDLEPGRWLIVDGERVDVLPLTGVKSAELVMLSGVEHGANDSVPGDLPHSTLILKEPLAYEYRRDTVNIHANVAKATHGETRVEVLGSGDGSQAFQSFELKQAPITYLAAPTAKGAEPTLSVRVNDLLWKEGSSLGALTPEDRRYVLRTSDEQKTTIIFGDGYNGARLPTGRENVKAVYRTGIGSPGNVAAGQITILSSRPLGLKGVTNPMRASGGGDRDTAEQARRNTPLALQALDRLISVPDYAFFARSFAGIGKASAALLSRDGRPAVHVTIAGAGDAPIDPPSDLYQNLLDGLRRQGDPSMAVDLALRRARFLIVSADVLIHPDYQWEAVYAQIRKAVYDVFSFDRRDFGQPAYLSDVYRIIQQIPGVAVVDVNVFDAVDSAAPIPDLATLGESLSLRTAIGSELASVDADGTIVPASLVYMNATLPETLIINRRES